MRSQRGKTCKITHFSPISAGTLLASIPVFITEDERRGISSPAPLDRFCGLIVVPDPFHAQSPLMITEKPGRQ